LIDEVVLASVIDDVQRKFAISDRSCVDGFSIESLLVRLARAAAEEFLILPILIVSQRVEHFSRFSVDVN